MHKVNYFKFPSSKSADCREPVTLVELNVGYCENKEVLMDLVRVLNVYRDTVSKNISELGCTDLIEMKISEKPGSKPVCITAYTANFKERQSLKGIVKELKDAGISTETNSSYASPVLLVKRANAEPRMVVNSEN